MKTATAFAFATVVLAGCTASGDTMERLGVSATEATSQGPMAADGLATTGGTADEGVPAVTAPGTSPIRPDIQAAFCQDQVAFTQGTQRQYATARERVIAPDGSITIDVAVDKGIGGVKTFKCRLDASSRFVDVVPTSEGLL